MIVYKFKIYSLILDLAKPKILKNRDFLRIRRPIAIAPGLAARITGARSPQRLSSEMLHPLLDTVANFVWRIAVPRPWPSEHVRPERSDDQHDRGRISRNNARAHILLAVQAVTVAPFTCVYVSAATHLGRQPGVFPFKGNFRAFRSIIAAEGALGLFKVPAAPTPPHLR